MSNELNIPHTFSELEGKYKRMETEVMLTPEMKLSLTTYQKSSGDKCLMTYATVSKKLEGHSEPFLFSHRLGRDYHRVFKTCKVRVTAKAVKEQHGEFLKNIQGICEDAKRYYNVSLCEISV
jgi:hypothetical protein